MVTADLRANRVICHIDLDAPREGRPTTRVNWLIRQLRAAPDATRVEAFILHGRGAGTADLLRTIRDNPPCSQPTLPRSCGPSEWLGRVRLHTDLSILARLACARANPNASASGRGS